MGSNWGQIPIVLMFKEHAGYLMDSARPDHVVSQLLMSSEFGAFEISVKVLVRTDHQLFDGTLKGRGNKKAHQPNWYSPTGSSCSAIRMSRMTLKGRSGFSAAILPI